MSERDPIDKQLNLAWQALSPPDELQARVRARLSGAHGGASGAAASGAAVAASWGGRAAARWRSLRASGSLGVGFGAVLLGVGVALGYLIPRAPVEHATHDTRTAVNEAPRASTVVLPTPDVAPAPAVAEATPLPDAATAAAISSRAAAPRREPSAPVRARSHATPTRVATRDDGAELQLLERAERAVRAKHPALALALVRELEHDYPQSSLHEERRSIELMAHCQAQNADADVSARRSRFQRQYPDSVYSTRIAAECEPASQMTLTNSDPPDIDGAGGDKHVQDDSR